MLKIIFLGTAGTAAVMNKQQRASGGIILQAEELQFHLDPGPGALVKAVEYGINPAKTTAILVTHNHPNHNNDLNVLVQAMANGGKEARGIVLASRSVIEGYGDNQPVLSQYHRKLLSKVVAMDTSSKVSLELVEISALPAEHTDTTAIGFKFFCPKYTLAYTGDTALTPALLEKLSGTDILILNVPYPQNKAEGKNLDTDAALTLITQVHPKLVLLTHFGAELLKEDPLMTAREIQRITGVQTIAAQDGLAISPSESKSPVKGY